jgi:hypothetical protein
VHLPADGLSVGEIVAVEIIAALPNSLSGRPVGTKEVAA